jgi:N-acetylneuraminic acid mutarotase
MTVARTGAAAVMFTAGTKAGKVLMAGGSTAAASVELFDPTAGPAGAWSLAGILTPARTKAAAVALATGDVMVIGGENSSATAVTNVDLCNGTNCSPGAALPFARKDHTATHAGSLAWVVGGISSAGAYLGNATYWSTRTSTWGPTIAMADQTGRANHAAAFLPSGNLMVTGGRNAAGYKSTTELLNPSTLTFTSTTSLATARGFLSSAVLPAGDVLVPGGITGTYSASSAVERFAEEGVWSSGPNMNVRRAYGHTATLLDDGKVVVVGGTTGVFPYYYPTNEVEYYDPSSNTWVQAATIQEVRNNHTATLLHYWNSPTGAPTSKLLVVGGTSSTQARLFDTVSGWSSGGTNISARTSGHTATLLPSGRVLVVGGLVGGQASASVELYDPKTNVWTGRQAMLTPRQSHTATLLPDGYRVLVAGGRDASGTVLNSAEIYDAGLNSWTPAAAMVGRRYTAVAALLGNGTVLVASGYYTSNLNTAEIYDPVSGAWSSTGSMLNAENTAAALALPNGKVAVFPGWNSTGGVQVYDPATRAWFAAGAFDSRRSAPPVLLLSGRVLYPGGSTTGDTSTKMFGPPSWFTPPIISSVSPAGPGQVITVTGSGFMATSPCAGGTTTGAASNTPVFAVLSADGGRPHPLRSYAVTSTSANLVMPIGLRRLGHQNLLGVSVCGAWSNLVVLQPLGDVPFATAGTRPSRWNPNYSWVVTNCATTTNAYPESWPPNPSVPNQGVLMWDPVFHTGTVRDTARPPGQVPGYSRFSAFNADSSRLLLQTISGANNGRWSVIRYDTLMEEWHFPDEGGRTPSGDEACPRWHGRDPFVFFFLKRNARQPGGEYSEFHRYDLVSQADTLLFDVVTDPGSGYSACPGDYYTEISIGGTEGEPSAGSRYVVFQRKCWPQNPNDPSPPQYQLLAADLEAGAASRWVGSYVIPTGPGLDNASISATGEWVIANFQGTRCASDPPSSTCTVGITPDCGLMAYSRNFSTCKYLSSAAGHHDEAVSAFGQDVVVLKPDWPGHAEIEEVTISSLNTVPIALMQIGSVHAFAYHISGSSWAMPGWVVVSEDQDYEEGEPWNTHYLSRQIAAIKLGARYDSSSSQVVHLAHSRTRGASGYWTKESHAGSNADLTRVTWQANWVQAGSDANDEVMTFHAELPADLPARLPPATCPPP